MQYRVGTGFDVHAFEKGRTLMLGGIQIPYHSGLKGHSDADVLLHAIMDALLGTTGHGDIGLLFPDTDPAYKNIDSSLLLEKVVRLIQDENLIVVWLDAIVVAEEPKIRPFVEKIKTKLSIIMNVPESCISIKGKTTEGLGFIGRKEGIAAQAVITVEKIREK